MAEGRAGPAVWIATCAGIGYFPVIPGTAGSAIGLLIAAALGRAPVAPAWRVVILAALAIILFLLGVWAAGQAERFFGRTDPSAVVVDEVVGQMITFLARPQATWKWLVAGFILFRVLDVVKPFPAGRAERLPGGWGIMVDDVIAGAYSLVLLTLAGFAFK